MSYNKIKYIDVAVAVSVRNPTFFSTLNVLFDVVRNRIFQLYFHRNYSQYFMISSSSQYLVFFLFAGTEIFKCQISSSIHGFAATSLRQKKLD